MQYYPTLSCPNYAPITNVTAAVSTGQKIVLSGTTSGNTNRLFLYDPISNTTAALDSDIGEIEMYHLSYSESSNKVYFDGLRMADNQYVLGEVDLSTNTAEVISTTANKVTSVVGL